MADTNFNFDLSNFNKGIDEIQKRIQQMASALKVATDPKVVNNLTNSIKDASKELDNMKLSIAGVGSAISTIPNIGNAISSALNLAVTSMNAMVGSSANLVANLQSAQGLAIQPFTQPGAQSNTKVTNNTTTTPRANPAGGVSFGAGADTMTNNLNRNGKGVDDITIKLRELESAASQAFNNVGNNTEQVTQKTAAYEAAVQRAEEELKRLNLTIADQSGTPLSSGPVVPDNNFTSIFAEYTKAANEAKVSTDALSNAQANLVKSKSELANATANLEIGNAASSAAYKELTDKLNLAKLAALNLSTQMELMEGSDAAKKETAEYKKLEEQLARVNKKVSEYAGQKHKIETAVGGSGKSRFQNELFSVQQVLREMPAFTYSVQTGFLALSNNIPILIDDFKRMRTSVVGANGETLGFGKTLGMMAKELVSFTGIMTIVIGIVTMFGPKLWTWITGTKELTEAQKELSKEIKGAGDAYNDILSSMERNNSILKSSITTDEQKIVALRMLEDITGKDLVKSYNSMTESINAANYASLDFMTTIKQQIELDRNMVKVKFATNKILDAEQMLRGVEKKDPTLYKQQKPLYDKMSIADLEFVVGSLDKMSGALAQAVLDVKKYTGSLEVLGKTVSRHTKDRAGDVNKQIAAVIKSEQNNLQEDLAELAKKGILTDEKVSAMTIESKKKTIQEIRKLNKDASKKNNMFIFQEEEKIWLELDGLGRKATKKAKAAIKEINTKIFEDKNADIEKQLTEDYRNILNLRLQLTKDSYEKESTFISEKYDELDEKAKQRHKEEMKILEDAFNTRVDFQERESDIKETASKMVNQDAAQRYSEIELEKLKQTKKKEFEIFKQSDSQSVRSTQFLTKTIYLNHKNLYEELIKLAQKYALDREAFNRVFDKKLLLKNIISNEATLAIEKQQLENLYSELEQIREKRSFSLFEQPKETSVFVAWKEEAFKFTQTELPKIKEDLAKLLKDNPADRMVGVYQMAIENLKGKTVDLYNIFKETGDRMSVLSAQKTKDLEGVTDPGEIANIEKKYRDLTKLADYYIKALDVVAEKNKNLVVLEEDTQKFNSLLDRQVKLKNELVIAEAALRAANEDNTGSTENVSANSLVDATRAAIAAVTKDLDALKLKPIAPNLIDKEAFKLAIENFNKDIQADPNATIDYIPSGDIILAKFRKTLDQAKTAMGEGDMENFNKLLSDAFNISEVIQKGLTPEEKKNLKAAFDIIYNEAVAILDQNLDKKKAEIVKDAAGKAGFNTEGVPKKFDRSEMWKQNKVNEDIKKAELEHDRQLIQQKISANLATEEEIIAFHKREMDLVQEQKSRVSKEISDIANSIGTIFQTTFDAISTMTQNSMALANERMATQQALSDNMIASYDREISKIKEMTETQIMSAAERINAEQKMLDLERLKEQESKNQKIRQLELQKKQIETNKKLALAQAAISGGVALANVVAIAAEGAVGTGPAAPFVFAAELAAGIGAVGAAMMSAKQSINSSDAQIATIDAQIAGIEAAYQEGLNTGSGMTSESSNKSGASAPLTTFNSDLVNQGQSSANYNANDTTSGYKIYVTQADIQNANNQATKIKKKVTFG